MFEFNEAARFEEPCNDDRKAWLIGSFEIDSVAMLQLFWGRGSVAGILELF